VPYSIIGRVLAIDKGTVRLHFNKIVKNAGMQAPNGRPPILSHAQQDQLFHAIAEVNANGSSSTLADITSSVQPNFQVNIDKETLSDMIGRDPRLNTYPVISMDAKRVAITPEQIQNLVCEGFRITEGVSTHFVFNLEEMGNQESADRKNATCRVPSSH
jgi:uncharacterized protein YoaH (UPF0181 family)